MIHYKNLLARSLLITTTSPSSDGWGAVMAKFRAAVNVLRSLPTTPKVVCLCGSTKFKEQFEQANRKFSEQGSIVLTVGWFTHADGLEVSEPTKAKLDELHKRKIDLADIVYVINVNGYIGESTRGEIEYAHFTGKPVVYLEDERTRV